MTVNVPDDCVVMPRASVRELHDAHLECRKQLQQALARIQDLESRLAPPPEPSPDLFASCYSPPGWADPDLDPDAK